MAGIRPSEEFLLGMGRRLRERRMDARMSLQDVVDRTDLSLATVWEIEEGKQEPRASTLLRLARCFRLSVDWILWGDSVPTDQPPSGP